MERDRLRTFRSCFRVCLCAFVDSLARERSSLAIFLDEQIERLEIEVCALLLPINGKFDSTF